MCERGPIICFAYKRDGLSLPLWLRTARRYILTPTPRDVAPLLLIGHSATDCNNPSDLCGKGGYLTNKLKRSIYVQLRVIPTPLAHLFLHRAIG